MCKLIFNINIQKLGNGFFGTVHKAKYQGKFIAVKKIKVYRAMDNETSYRL